MYGVVSVKQQRASIEGRQWDECCGDKVRVGLSSFENFPDEGKVKVTEN